jgi:hypothetical protein
MKSSKAPRLEVGVYRHNAKVLVEVDHINWKTHKEHVNTGATSEEQTMPLSQTVSAD